MAGRPKAEWLARIKSIGRAFSEEKGMRIHIRISLDREPERNVSVFLDIQEAKKWRDALTHFIDKMEGK